MHGVTALVLAVGEHDDGFAPDLPAGHIHRAQDDVVQRGSAPRRETIDRLGAIRGLRRRAREREDRVVESQHRHLILGRHRVEKRLHGALQLRHGRRHAAADVHRDDQLERHIFSGKVGHRLRAIVFEHVKRLARQPLARSVRDCRAPSPSPGRHRRRPSRCIPVPWCARSARCVHCREYSPRRESDARGPPRRDPGCTRTAARSTVQTWRPSTKKTTLDAAAGGSRSARSTTLPLMRLPSTGDTICRLGWFCAVWASAAALSTTRSALVHHAPRAEHCRIMMSITVRKEPVGRRPSPPRHSLRSARWVPPAPCERASANR